MDKNIEISIRNLRKKFGNLVAVDNLSLDIYTGEIICILGPNGAGKTTAINIICGLSPCTDGEIIYKNDDAIRSINIKSRLGICPQENVYWPKLTCREQLLFMASMYNVSNRVAKSRMDFLLQVMGLEEKANVIAKKLSGGMKRRLSISLALVHDPDILILDEPEAGLDPQSRILVRGLIKELARKKTIIITTHNMDEADRLSDRVAIIDFGKLLLADTPQNLKKTVGEGDVLEFIVEDCNSENVNSLITDLAAMNCKATLSKNNLLVQSKRIIEKISEVTRIITSNNIGFREMTMRENTLEDVFIHLTGRKLRE